MSQNISAEIKLLQGQFAQGLKKRLEDFDTKRDQLLGSLNQENSLSHIQALEFLAHSLSGASGTFLFTETNSVAKLLEAECIAIRQEAQIVGDAEGREISGLINSLKEAVEKDRARLEDDSDNDSNIQLNTAEAADRPINVLLVEDDDIQASVMKLQLANFGFHSSVVNSPDKLASVDFSGENAPDIILMDIMFDGDHDAGLRIVQNLRETGRLNLPVIFISARGDIHARLHAVRCSGDGYIAKPVDVLELTETIKQLTLSRTDNAFEMLLIGADDTITHEFSAMLENTSITCHNVTQLDGLLDALEERPPHVILMNTIMTDCSGTELASTIRQVNNDFARIPIVFFSDSAPDKETLLDLRASGDDMLVLPVDPDIFVQSLETRCKRTRDIRNIIRQRRQVDQRFYALAKSVNDAVITTNAQNRVIFWNKTAEKLFGYQAIDTISMHISQIFAKEHHNVITMEGPMGLIKSGDQGYPTPVEMYGVTSTGDKFPIEVSATRWDNNTHRYVGYIIRDISERKAIEDALERNRIALADKTQVLQTTMDSIDQGLVVWDEDYNMNIHSRKCMDFWYQPDANIVAPGTPMKELMRHLAAKGAFGEGDMDEIASLQVERVMEESDHSSEEIVLMDGRILDIHRFPMPGGGYVAKYTDITKERHTQQALENAAQKEKDANRAKSEFLSSMSHELRTPMNAILGFAQMMTISKKDPPTQRQMDQLDHILKAGNHLLKLIDEVLDLSRIEAGKLDYSIIETEFPPILDECLIYVGNSANQRSITIDTTQISDNTRKLLGDEKCLRQVLINFLSNAVKYNETGGTITVRLEEQPGNRARVCVSDTGIGIPEHRMGELFQTFNRLDAKNSDVQGTGIGLAISKNLVELMNGTIGAESELGKGSTFWFEIPFAD